MATEAIAGPMGTLDAHWYLIFENAASRNKIEFVDGASIGKLLVKRGTLILVLNACRSAYAEPLTAPLDLSRNPNTGIRMFGSLAQCSDTQRLICRKR